MHTLNFGGKLVPLHQPMVMGIINATPDSFFAGSRAQAMADAVELAGQMLQQGAGVIDVGGQSTRPGAELLGPEAEAERVVPAIAAICRQYPDAIVSVDTFHAAVAEMAVGAGARMVNDVSGGLADAAMLATVGRLHVPYVCMHSRGNAQTMQQWTDYTDVITDLIDFFAERLQACRQAGIHDVVVDPGFGFAKTIPQNFVLLRRLQALQVLGVPMLAGLSRKRTIYQTLNITPEEALNGSTVLHTIALMHGASLLRVHDVREAVEAVTLVNAMKTAQ